MTEQRSVDPAVAARPVTTRPAYAGRCAVPRELRDRLRSTPVAWLTTVRPDGRPHLVPVWYAWTDDGFVVFSKPGAVKALNVAADARVMVALGAPEDDFDVQLIEGEARILPDDALKVVPSVAPQLLAKYASWMSAIGLTLAEFGATYRSVIRIEPTRFLGWRGRTGRRELHVGGPLMSAA